MDPIVSSSITPIHSHTSDLDSTRLFPHESTLTRPLPSPIPDYAQGQAPALLRYHVQCLACTEYTRTPSQGSTLPTEDICHDSRPSGPIIMDADNCPVMGQKWSKNGLAFSTTSCICLGGYRTAPNRNSTVPTAIRLAVGESEKKMMVFVHVGILLLSVTGPAHNAQEQLCLYCTVAFYNGPGMRMGKKVGRSRGHPVMAAESPRFSPHLERDEMQPSHPSPAQLTCSSSLVVVGWRSKVRMVCSRYRGRPRDLFPHGGGSKTQKKKGQGKKRPGSAACSMYCTVQYRAGDRAKLEA